MLINDLFIGTYYRWELDMGTWLEPKSKFHDVREASMWTEQNRGLKKMARNCQNNKCQANNGIKKQNKIQAIKTYN